jgi:SAM-dependent methyltransferase
VTDAPEYADPERYIELVGFKGSWRNRWYNPDFLGLMAHRWDVSGVRRALDVGCGAGHWLRTLLPFLPPECEVVGVDREPRFLELAREHAEREGHARRSTFVAGDANALPFEDASFDLVTCQTVLMHVPDVPAALREMIRVLRPGGLLITAEPDNLAGNAAHLQHSLSLSVEDRVTMFRFRAVTERGKLALGEGDSSIGALLPGLFENAGLSDVRAHTNDRCLVLAPPYDREGMKDSAEDERRWAADGISCYVGTRHDARRFFLAGGGDEADFDACWSTAERVMQTLVDGMDAGTFHAARGFVMYLVSGRKPA